MPVDVATQTDLPYYTTQAALDGVTYTLQLRWTPRLAAWLLTVLDDQGATVLVGDFAIRVNFPIASYQTGRSPPGSFVAIDTSGQGLDPGIADLGGRVKLVYFTSSELGIS